MRMVIYGIGIGAAFVMITVYRNLGEI